MKKNILTLITMAAMTLGCGSAMAAGDIYDIRPCNEYGQEIKGPVWPKTDSTKTAAGGTVRFRVRFYPREVAVSATPEAWYLEYVGTGSVLTDKAMYPLQMGLFTSGVSNELSFATISEYSSVTNIGGMYNCTDFVFEYTTKNGDFALPVVLAMEDNQGKAVRATDTSSSLTKYFLRNADKWAVKFRMSDGSIAEANWSITTSVIPASKYARESDVSLAGAGYNVKTVDFGSEWTQDAYWRTVHEDSTITDSLSPLLKAQAAMEKTTTYFVWSTNEAAVVMAGDGVYEKSMIDPASIVPGKSAGTNAIFHVAKVTIVGGKDNQEFLIRGVKQDGVSQLVLSPYDEFNVSSSTGEIIQDYITVPVKCVEPMPPSVIVESSVETAEAVHDWGTAALRLTVKLSQHVDQDFTVKITPSFNHASTMKPSQYVRFSLTQDTVDEPPAAEYIPEVTLGGTAGDSATVFVFCLRGDGETTGNNKMQFVPSSDDPPAEIGDRFVSKSINIVGQAPEIIEPLSTYVFEPYQNEATELPIVVEGTYADDRDPNDENYQGYKVYFCQDYSASRVYAEIDGKFQPGEGGVLYKIDEATGKITTEMPKFTYNKATTYEKPFKTVIYVKSLDSGKSSEICSFDAVPKAAKTCWAETASGETRFRESDEEIVDITVKLSDAYNEGKVYAFLKPDEDFTNFKIIDAYPYCIVTNETSSNCQGLEIHAGATSAECDLYLKDGYKNCNIGFEVILRDQRNWNDPTAKEIGGFSCTEPLVLSVTNVVPVINYVTLNSTPMKTNGGTFKNQYPKGQEQKFTVDVDDVDNDRTSSNFTCVWTIERDGDDPEEKSTYGNPKKEGALNYKFEKDGDYTISVKVQDKDMSKPSTDEFVVHLTVIDNPTVFITVNDDDPTSDAYFVENDTKAKVAVQLSYYDASEPLVVKLEAQRFNTEVNGDYGEFVFELTNIVFESSNPQYVSIKRMDGTDLSDTYGWRILASVTNKTVNPKTKEPWNTYYLQGEKRVYVSNIAPNDNDLREETFMPAANSETNRWTCSGVASDHPITIKIRKDVDLDFASNIVVQLIGADGSKYNKDGFVNGKLNVKEPTTVTYTPDFTGFEGDQQITVIVSDKDGGQLSRTWYYSMSKSKTLTTIAHGPSGGNSAFSLSTKYEGAAGLGKGHVYVTGSTFTSASKYWLSWNCGVSASALLYGFGYKVGDIDNGGLEPYDQAIDASGDAKAGTTPTSSYAYDDKVYDSFLYTWIQNLTDENGASSSTFLGSVAPEKSDGKIASSEVTLPTEANEDGTWPKTTVEAIFAKEMFPADNMGDINQDGIPDLYVSKYYFDVIDATSGQITEGGKDLVSLKSYNEDADFLPLGYDNLGVWITNATPFTAYLEVRGYGDGLNDAAADSFPDGAKNPVTMSGVKVERHYTDPDNDKNVDPKDVSTLSKIEYQAWLRYAAANKLVATDESNWVKWSPERPTDPTMADTDEDGFDDGLEYWFWYRAHVGDPITGKRITGRKYDPRNPGEGKLITSDQIETIFDPIVSAGDASSLYQRDTDNDGLPDLLEFWVGTNPVDFDSDGDGLPDGWEIMISGTDPLAQYTTAGTHDSLRNYDGDAMAFTTPTLEAGVMPTPNFVQKLTTFAVIDADGDSDGVQWYVCKSGEEAALTYTETAQTGWKFTADGQEYVTDIEPVTTEDGRLAIDISREHCFTLGSVPKPASEEEEEGGEDEEGGETTEDLVGEGEEEGGEYENVRLLPTYIPAGTLIEDVTPEFEYTSLLLTAAPKEANINAAWQYGRKATSNTGVNFGMLTIGRHQTPALDNPENPPILAAAPAVDDTVAYMHSIVYQEFGFDPRTAWNPNSPPASRWGVSEDGEAVSGVFVVKQGGYCAYSVRTREYTAYDEFLVYSFFLNSGVDMTGITTSIDDNSMAETWYNYTTNPQGPGEPDLNVTRTESDQNEENSVSYYGRNDGNGADTDGDGVPDGWELYTMAGPKSKGKYVFAPPYTGFATAFSDSDTSTPSESYWSPFVAAAKSSESNNQRYLGGSSNNDGLNQFREFSGTDSCKYYSDLYKAADGGEELRTIVSREEQTVDNGFAVDDSKWLNKFFPTDPWNIDTDGDGVSDSDEGGAFVYGTPVDNGKIWSIPGGGLNPCTVDTDLDGLPDGWEVQFKGSTIYAGDDPRYASGLDDSTGLGNPLEGLVDGMDGTVPDDRSTPNAQGDGNTVITYVSSDGRCWSGKVNRDYDHDGLENWQEYLVGAMRCWRYDDPMSPFTAIPEEAYFDKDGKFDALRSAEYFKLEGKDDEEKKSAFWYNTLVDKNSPIYNPRFVTDSSSGAFYFSKVDNPWDCAYYDLKLDGSSHSGGAYYIFYHRINSDKISDLWGQGKLKDLLASDMRTEPSKYISCSPLSADTDHDGMDDYYELFHGMNPLLGASGVKDSSSAPCDIVFSAWAGSTERWLEAWGESETRNYWQVNPWKEPRGENKYDFAVFPWLTGEAVADPDGDDVPNQSESIMALLSTDTFHHTDPTPLWMTDTSYSNSLTRLFFRLPTRFKKIEFEGDGFEYGEGEERTTYYFRNFDCYAPKLTDPAHFGVFNPDFWGLVADEKYNWIASFEENEGYDSDHDGVSDYEESQGKIRSASDPINFDSPNRRQAMYFPGVNAALQTMPFERMVHPLNNQRYPDDVAFKQYTVECWVKPERNTDQTIIERAIWNRYTNPGDKEYLRCNFQLGIKNGKWYTKFDPEGTTVNPVSVIGATDIEVNEWTHLAATYDCNHLVLYVNGVPETPTESELTPEYGREAMSIRQTDGTEVGFKYRAGDYHFGKELKYQAILIGASFKGNVEGGTSKPLDITNGEGWQGNYDHFFKGYVDEVRIWDGARSTSDIVESMYLRATADSELAEAYPSVYLDITENRNSFYSQWYAGRRRYAKDSEGDDYEVIPELRYHYSFDSIFAAADEASVAIVPRGFDTDGGKAIVSRPDGYEISWWKTIVNGYGSVYAGYADCVPWIANTVTHMPLYDGTTLDSVYWSENFRGGTNGTFKFSRSAEPASRWTQLVYNGAEPKEYGSVGSRHHLVNDESICGSNSTLSAQFEFAGRNLNQTGDDLLPIGGAYAKYCDDMWDDNGASSSWELTGSDSNGNGLPDWWEEYLRQNKMIDLPTGVDLEWDSIITYKGNTTTAGIAYLRDIASGTVLTKNGVIDEASEYAQTADVDNSKIPDWWEQMYGIELQPCITDSDNDGLNNRIEYLVSEVLPFGIKLNPVSPMSDAKTLDYFRKVGKLYLGEMLTDHDMMEDYWERSLADYDNIDYMVWDALRDGDEDGWTNFEENRYNGYSQTTIANLVSHIVGDSEVLDAPIPAIKLTVRYNGQRDLSASAEGKPGEGSSASGSDSQSDSTGSNSSDIDIGKSDAAKLVVEVLSDDNADKVDATYSLQPGQSISKAVYLGGWEDRVVRGTMTPGHINLGSVNLYFAQVPQSDLYSWTDENGTHISRPYKEFKEALQKNPDIIQNVQEFEWLTLAAPVNDYTSADKAVYVVADSSNQKGYITVYGERVGTIDLETGDYEFNMTAMNELSPNYTFQSSTADAWGYKEAIFKLTYSATVPSVQQDCYLVSLAKPDSGFVKGGKNTIRAYYDINDDGYTPGEDPMGILRDVDISWAGTSAEIELTEMCSITPRMDLWTESDCDRCNRTDYEAESSNRFVSVFGEKSEDGGGMMPGGGEDSQSSLPTESRIRVARYRVNGDVMYVGGVKSTVVLDRTFKSDVRSVLDERDFIGGDVFDIDWNLLEDEVISQRSAMRAWPSITNVDYIVVYGNGATSFSDDWDTNTVVSAHPLLLNRRFEAKHTAPTAIQEAVCTKARPTFSWKIENEEPWAAAYGTTYTAFRIRVWDSTGKTLVYDSDYQRMPACDTKGVYSWKAPLYVGAPSPSSGIMFENLKNYTWKVYTYNAKYKTDDVGSETKSFRMNVTEEDGSSCSFGVCVAYNGPATSLDGKLHVQAYATPDFSGYPAAEVVVDDVSTAALSPTNDVAANATLLGLNPGTYFVRAYIDTNGNSKHDDWESWGYLSERDRGCMGGTVGIFNPVSVTVSYEAKAPKVRRLYVEDCDTNRNWFPDVWEAEMNGNDFDVDLVKAVTGDAELIGVNPWLSSTLNKSDIEGTMMSSLNSSAGVALLTGVAASQVKETSNGYVVEPKVDGDTVKIVGFEVKPEEREVVLKVGAELDAEIDESVASALSVTVAKGAQVTVKVYRIEKLGDDWGDPIVTKQIVINGDGADIDVSFDEELPNTGYFKTTVEQ